MTPRSLPQGCPLTQVRKVDHYGYSWIMLILNVKRFYQQSTATIHLEHTNSAILRPLHSHDGNPITSITQMRTASE
jgi:hypothetical protein